PDAEAGVERADPRSDLPEDRVLRRDREVADHVQDVAAADSVAVDKGDDRDRQGADLTLEVQDVEPGDAVGSDVAPGVALVTLVAAGAERPVPGPGEQHASDRRVVADPREGVDELADRFRPERVVDLGPVDRDLRDPGPG